MAINSTTAVRTTTALRQAEAKTERSEMPKAVREAQLTPAVMRMEASPEAVASSRARAGGQEAMAQARLLQGVHIPGGGVPEGIHEVHHRPDHGAGIVAPPPNLPRPPANLGQPPFGQPNPNQPRPPSQPNTPGQPTNPFLTRVIDA
jgi:hypothetical protein